MNDALGDDANWQTIFNASFIAEKNVNGKSLPIGGFVIPYIFNNQYIRIYCKSINAKSHWYLAGDLNQLLPSNSGIPFEGKETWRIPLNRIKLIEIPRLTTNYQLNFQIAKWHKDMAIVVEVFTGV